MSQPLEVQPRAGIIVRDAFQSWDTVNDGLHLTEFTSTFHNLVKHANYLSDFSEDIVRFRYSAGGGIFEENRVDLRKFWIPSSSVYSNAERFTDRRELASTAKALINIVLSKGSHKSSPISALYNFEMLCAWMRNHDIYNLRDLTRDHVNEFMGEAAKGSGVASGLNARLMKLLDEHEERFAPSERKERLQSLLLIRKKLAKAGIGFAFNLDKISDAIGMRVSKAISRPFIKRFSELAEIPLEDFMAKGFDIKPITVSTLTRVANTINLLNSIPSDFNTIRFYAFPDTSEEFFLKYDASPRGRTRNLSLDDAVEIMAGGARWVIEYADAFFMLGQAARNLLIKYPNTPSYHVPLKLAAEVSHIKEKTGIDINAVTGTTIRNFVDVVLAFHLLTSACISVIYSNTARRHMEVASTKYGLTYGCLKKSELGVYSMRVYIEKSVKDYVITGINFLAGKAIEVLKTIQDIYSDLKSHDLVASDQSLFKARKSFSKESYADGNFTGPNVVGTYLPIWIKLVLGNDSVHVLPHMWRRFYAVLYFYRYDFPQLSALSKHFYHFSESRTFTYITDKRLEEYASSISEMLKLREINLEGTIATVIEEVDIEFIKIFDSVAEEYMLQTIIKAAEGKTSGGFVRSLLKRVAEYVKHFNTEAMLTDPERFVPLAKKLIKEGHLPKPLANGICFARETAYYQAHEANCAKDGKIDRSQASCSVCSGCSNHGTHSGTMDFLQGEISHYEGILADFSQSALKHEHARKELSGLLKAKQYHLSEFERNKKIVIKIFPVRAQ
jgi:hypothetical protein